MKRIFSLIVCAAFALLLGCASNPSSGGQSSEGSAQTAEVSADSGSDVQSSDTSEGSEGSGQTSEQQGTAAGISLLGSFEWPSNHVTEGVPVPQFSTPITSLYTSDYGVSATWDGVTEEEVAAYVESLKASDLSHQVQESTHTDRYTYSATNMDSETYLAGNAEVLRSVQVSFSINANDGTTHLSINASAT